MSTLFLTKEEEHVFNALPQDVREGWTVESEVLTYNDTIEKQIMRLSLLRLHDPKLLALRSAAQNAPSVEDVVVLLQDFDLQGVDEDDLAELFFGMGPTVLNGLIALQLQSVKTDTDLEGVTALSVIRHSLLNAFNPAL